MAGLATLGAEPFLPALFLLPVTPACMDTLGVLTTNDDSDLSFLLAGGEFTGVTSGSAICLLLGGKILALISARLLSGLHYAKGEYKLDKRKKKNYAHQSLLISIANVENSIFNFHAHVSIY